MFYLNRIVNDRYGVVNTDDNIERFYKLEELWDGIEGVSPNSIQAVGDIIKLKYKMSGIDYIVPIDSRQKYTISSNNGFGQDNTVWAMTCDDVNFYIIDVNLYNYYINEGIKIGNIINRGDTYKFNRKGCVIIGNQFYSLRFAIKLIVSYLNEIFSFIDNKVRYETVDRLYWSSNTGSLLFNLESMCIAVQLESFDNCFCFNNRQMNFDNNLFDLVNSKFYSKGMNVCIFSINSIPSMYNNKVEILDNVSKRTLMEMAFR